MLDPGAARITHLVTSEESHGNKNFKALQYFPVQWLPKFASLYDLEPPTLSTTLSISSLSKQIDMHVMLSLIVASYGVFNPLKNVKHSIPKVPNTINTAAE